MSAAVLRLRLVIAYDGRPFRGWQSQATRDTVQDYVEAAFAKITGQRLVVHGSGRTDTGVHALAQIAHVEVPPPHLPPTRWLPALNRHLPPEIRILKVTTAPANFHARFNACGKIYTYRIWNDPTFHPLEIGRAWHVPIPLDLGTLRAGADLLLGTHDFAGFAANRASGGERDTVRTMHAIRINARRPLITLRFEGDGFLYKMVRLLTGTLVRCATGRANIAWISELLAHPRRGKTHFSAPPDGLYLTRVLYPRGGASNQPALDPLTVRRP